LHGYLYLPGPFGGQRFLLLVPFQSVNKTHCTNYQEIAMEGQVIDVHIAALREDLQFARWLLGTLVQFFYSSK